MICIRLLSILSSRNLRTSYRKPDLDYGKNLGAEFQSGLAASAVWGKTDPEFRNQDLIWQVGARIHISPGPDTKISVYPNPASDVLYVSINDENLTYDILRIFDLQGKILHEEHIDRGQIL